MKKKYVIIPAIVVLALTAIVLSFSRVTNFIRLKAEEFNVSSLTPEETRTLDSVRKIDNRLYVMDDYGDHSQFLQLKDKYYWSIGIPKPKCSTFAVTDQSGNSFFGRNNDNLNCPVLLLFTHPKDGYASVCTVDISEYGFDTGKNTPLVSRQAATRLLYAPYAVSDGMNEWGLTVGTMSVHTSPDIAADPDKEYMTNGEMRRYILDHAKNVNEAVDLLSHYNVKFPQELEHFLIADPSGNAVVVEWPEGHMQVIRSNGPWMAATNFTIAGSENALAKYKSEYDVTGKISEDTPGRKYWRYFTMEDSLSKMSGETINSDDAMNLLSEVSLTASKDMNWPTQWSVVYDMKTGEISIATGRNYNEIYRYRLEMKK